jgi:hypothetical protein
MQLLLLLLLVLHQPHSPLQLLPPCLRLLLQ